MKLRIGIAAVVSVVLGCVAAGRAHQAGSDVKAIIDAYLQIQTQLAGDSIQGLGGPAQTIVTKAGALKEEGTRVAAGAKAVGDAEDLKSAREAFGPLSDAVVELAKAHSAEAGDVKLAYCPMVGRSWLQKEEKVRNPYYGSKMLECGEFKELKK